jgi:hypothetical protein
MYELVETSRQQKKFEKTWEYFCKKYGWMNDPYAKNGHRYNIVIYQGFIYKRKKAIGTIEFIPYDPNNKNSTVEGPDRFKFSKYDEIRLNKDYIWEIDKLCIHQNYQRQGHFHTLLRIISQHAIQNNAKYYLALIEEKLYRMLRISFGSFIVRKGEAFIGPSTSFIPTVINIQGILYDEEKGYIEEANRSK